MSEGRPPPSWPPRLVAALTFALLYLPLVTVIVYSFLIPVPGDAGGRWTVGWLWYERLFQNEVIGAALALSVQIAAAVSAVSTLLGTLGALAIERGRFPGRGVLAAATVVPLVMPELVLGLASLLWFVALRLTLGVHSIVLAHVTFAVSYVTVTVRARLAGFDRSLEEAAADLGAGPGTVFRRVTLPLLLPGILAGAMMAFTISFDDFLISFFTAGAGTDTLPMKLYGMIRFGLNREMYALSSLLITVTAAGLFVSRRLTRGRSAVPAPPTPASPLPR